MPKGSVGNLLYQAAGRTGDSTRIVIQSVLHRADRVSDRKADLRAVELKAVRLQPQFVAVDPKRALSRIDPIAEGLHLARCVHRLPIGIGLGNTRKGK